MSCPCCGAILNRLVAPDVTVVREVLTAHRRIVERPVLAVVYACPACEFTQTDRRPV